MAELDTSGMICPLPVLRARKALQDLAAGEILVVRATDPAAVQDFPAFCRAAGHTLVHIEEKDGGYIFRIAKKK